MTSPAPRPDPEPPAADGDRAYVGRMSYEEYRRYDHASELRHEYVDGVVYAVTGSTLAHGVISLNIAARLHGPARAAGCRTLCQTFKVRTPRGNEYVPDVVVVCGPRASNRALYTESPCLVVEVLSPGTARTDLSEKRLAYQEIGTVDAYLVVEAEWRGVHRHWRDPAGAWRLDTVTGDGAIALPCPAGEVLTLAEVYADLDLPAGPPPVPRLRRGREGAPAGSTL